MAAIALDDIRTDFSGWVLLEQARVGARNEGRIDGSLALKLYDYSATGIEYGIDAAQGSARPRENRLTAYSQASWGRIQLGDATGPLARLLPRAPTVGLGQIDGDAAFFTGRPALLVPYNLDDDISTRLAYQSPAFLGVELGVAYAPRLGWSLIEPRSSRFPAPRATQRNAVEIALAGTKTIGAVELKAGAGYVRGQGIGVHDLDAWSIGLQASWEGWVLGGGYVRDGKSGQGQRAVDGLAPTSRGETNVGLAWKHERWGVAVSYAREELERRGAKERYGIGGTWQARPWLELMADAVRQEGRSLLLLATRLTF